MKPILLSVVRFLEFKSAKFDGSAGENCAVNAKMAAARIVVLIPSVVCVLAPVPDIRKLHHGLRFPAVQFAHEARVNRLAVAFHSVVVKVQCADQKFLVGCHNVRQVPKRLRGVSVCANVNVDARPNT